MSDSWLCYKDFSRCCLLVKHTIVNSVIMIWSCNDESLMNEYIEKGFFLNGNSRSTGSNIYWTVQ